MKQIMVAALLASAFTFSHAASAEPEGRFGYLLPSVRNVQANDIPRRDRYAKAIAESMATAASITAVAIPAHTPSGLDIQALCKSMDLAGVIDPYVGWMANEDTVSARAQAFVLDCHGTVFYQGDGSDVGAIDSKLASEPQVDARMTVATERLAQRFVTFNKANAAAWDKLRLAVTPALLSKVDAFMAQMAALANCGSYSTAKRFVQAIAACNDADVAVNIAPSLTKMMQRKQQDDAARSYVATFGLVIVGAYYWQADAHYQLGEPTAGLSEATACASWINSVTAYFKHIRASEMNSQLRATDDELKAMRLNLEIRYPTVISP